MGLTPSAATAANLLGMLPTACLKTSKSTKNVLLLFLLCAVATNDNWADGQTKSLAAPAFHRFAKQRSLRQPPLRPAPAKRRHACGGLAPRQLPAAASSGRLFTPAAGDFFKPRAS